MTQEHAGNASGSHTTFKGGGNALSVATTADIPQATKKTVRRQQKVGRVVSDKMEKTRVVAVETLKRHRIYKRTYRQTKRFHVHDEGNSSHIGDLVRIEESRPISKLKRWRLVEILKPGSGIVPVEEVVAQANPNLTGSREESGENALQNASQEE
jgi:small subunit ribosomal protein S17